MLTIGYTQVDGSVKYFYTSDDALENIIHNYIYKPTDIETLTVAPRDSKKCVESVSAYFDADLSEIEDTPYRLLKKVDGTWMISTYYGGKQRIITFSESS
jgi:hypothetical protein